MITSRCVSNFNTAPFLGAVSFLLAEFAALEKSVYQLLAGKKSLPSIAGQQAGNEVYGLRFSGAQYSSVGEHFDALKRALLDPTTEIGIMSTRTFRKLSTLTQKTITDRLREQLERRQRVRFWGRDYFVIPRLCDKIFGDGRQLIGFEPHDSRPNFYIVRVDSTWILSNLDHGEPHLGDHLEEIWEALEEQYGRKHYYHEPEDEYHPFPAVASDNGVAWFRLPWPDGFAPPPPESISPTLAAELEEVGPSL